MVTKLFERVQIDLIDMWHEPDGQWKWIVHMKDHFSKFSKLDASKSNSAEEIAEVVWGWIVPYGPMDILQSDNGSELKEQWNG